MKPKITYQDVFSYHIKEAAKCIDDGDVGWEKAGHHIQIVFHYMALEDIRRERDGVGVN